MSNREGNWIYRPESGLPEIDMLEGQALPVPNAIESSDTVIGDSTPLWIDSSGWILGYSEVTGLWLYREKLAILFDWAMQRG